MYNLNPINNIYMLFLTLHFCLPPSNSDMLLIIYLQHWMYFYMLFTCIAHNTVDVCISPQDMLNANTRRVIINHFKMSFADHVCLILLHKKRCQCPMHKTELQCGFICIIHEFKMWYWSVYTVWYHKKMYLRPQYHYDQNRFTWYSLQLSIYIRIPPSYKLYIFHTISIVFGRKGFCITL